MPFENACSTFKDAEDFLSDDLRNTNRYQEISNKHLKTSAADKRTTITMQVLYLYSMESHTEMIKYPARQYKTKVF